MMYKYKKSNKKYLYFYITHGGDHTTGHLTESNELTIRKIHSHSCQFAREKKNSCIF